MSLLTDEIRAFVNRTKLGFVATVCADGTPNLSPKGTTIAWDEEHIAFADIHSPGTVKNLLFNPSIEINVVDIFTRKGYRFKGFAQVHGDGKIYNDVAQFYKSLGAEYKINHVILTKVTSVLPISSPAYDRLSEDEIIMRWIDYWDDVHKTKK